jgi:phosphinothricin acetyltransferase
MSMASRKSKARHLDFSGLCPYGQEKENPAAAVNREGVEILMKPYFFESLSPGHRIPVIDIFNHYIEHSYAAYPDEKVGYDFYDMIMGLAGRYPSIAVRIPSGDVVGFALLRPYHPAATFKRAAELSLFLKPEYTNKGIGTAILSHMVDEAKKRDVDTLLSSISSRNEASITFHQKHGFQECGRFNGVGKKFGQDFDVIWMQKMI